jgi:inner membrane protein
VSVAGMAVPVVLSSDGKNNFEFEIALKGSQTLHVIPVGKTTDVTMQSPWQNPSFGGAFLPTERNITDKGFTASWKVLHLNRNFPQQWISSAAPNISDSAFGVELFTPNDGYQQTSRSVKYAILVIALTFMVFFFNEMLNKKRVHAFQYILIGFALCIFYTLLLSISEYLNFNWAYGIASAMTLGLVFWYSKSILGENRPAVIILLLMGLLYGFIFTIIQLEDAALLVGTLGLFVILAVVMYISKKIDWYAR